LLRPLTQHRAALEVGETRVVDPTRNHVVAEHAGRLEIIRTDRVAL
jgi:hypothetical protein